MNNTSPNDYWNYLAHYGVKNRSGRKPKYGYLKGWSIDVFNPDNTQLRSGRKTKFSPHIRYRNYNEQYGPKDTVQSNKPGNRNRATVQQFNKKMNDKSITNAKKIKELNRHKPQLQQNKPADTTFNEKTPQQMYEEYKANKRKNDKPSGSTPKRNKWWLTK